MAQRPVPATQTPRLEEQLCFAVYLAGHAFNRMYRTVLADLGLTYPQYLVMLVLWERDGVGVKAVGERLMLDSGTLTPLLKRLETAGLIRRERSRQDERQVRLVLTAAGEGMREKAHCVPRAMRCAIDGEPAEIEQLKAQLLALRQALLKAADKAV